MAKLPFLKEPQPPRNARRGHGLPPGRYHGALTAAIRIAEEEATRTGSRYLVAHSPMRGPNHMYRIFSEHYRLMQGETVKAVAGPQEEKTS